MDNSQTIYTAEEVAGILRISVTTVWRKCRDDGWPHMMIGRFYRFTAYDIEQIQEILRSKIVRPVRDGKRLPL